jgi:hypothetical protein
MRIAKAAITQINPNLLQNLRRGFILCQKPGGGGGVLSGRTTRVVKPWEGFLGAFSASGTVSEEAAREVR